MHKIPSTEAKANFAELIRRAEYGETVAITRHGRAVAHVVPARSQVAVDAALVANWLMEGMMLELEEEWMPEHEAVVAVEHIRRRGGLVPPNWHSDVRNALFETEQRGSLREAHMAEALTQLKALPIVTDQEADLDKAMDLARKHGLSFQAAQYLELARRRSLTLATMDTDLERAALAERVDVFNAYDPLG
ncbi:MAG: type II toxin-antitoxin system prevent-host-death family antitoxin [Chloroflexota bacterium]|nr:type II toxin-antitoxin system prevent-host-death family antitoxin [Chloroflexota bacterium]